MPDRDFLKIGVELVGNVKYEGDIIAYAFTKDGKLIDTAPVDGDSVALPFKAEELRGTRVLFGPAMEEEPTVEGLTRLNAFEAVFDPRIKEHVVRIPDSIINLWPLCFCYVTGRVMKNGRPVCDARVHICEVDHSYWISVLTDLELFELRKDLLEIVRDPRPLPDPIPDPIPDPFGGQRPGPRPLPNIEPLRIERNLSIRKETLRSATAKAALPTVDLLPERTIAALSSPVASVVRGAILRDYQILIPYLCFYPRWWRYRCDELAVVTTDSNGRFGRFITYNCLGDKPDIYVWVEYEIGGTFQTVYRPPIPCNTRWNYVCGTEITIPITDPRVPVCDPEPDLEDCVVAVMSIGRNVSVSEVQTAAGASEGLVTGGAPFGGTLEPRVDFSRTCLIDKGITHYRWSMRRLTGPDGTTPALGAWEVLDSSVYRHYRVFQGGVLSYPSEQLGPDAAGPVANAFKIKPLNPPSPGTEWVTLNERVDLASGYFRSRDLPGAPASRADGDDSSAGKYELKLELFKTGSAQPVEWETEGVEMKISDQPAPFGTGTVTTVDAPAYNRITVGGNTVAFRMVVHVDNNFCQAEVFSAASTSPSVCGVLPAGPSDQVTLGFLARHPNGFATFDFDVERGDNAIVPIAEATSSALNGYVEAPAFEYRKTITASLLLGACPQAAFAEEIYVNARATDGYSELSLYDARDLGAFALTTP